MIDIFGIDHICGTCNNIDIASNVLSKLNFKPIFKTYNLNIMPEKKLFLKQNVESHDSVFLSASSNGLSIEMINHHSNNETHGNYEIIIEGNSKQFINESTYVGEDALCKLINSQFKYKLAKFHIPKLDLFCYYKKSESFSGISNIVLKCKNIEQVVRFWTQGLGFEFVEKSNKEDIWHLRFTGPIDNWNTSLLLIEDKDLQINNSYLDSSGWTCVSFIVNEIELCIKKLKFLGAINIGKWYNFKINEKNMRLAFLSGPSMELIELIEFKK